MQSWVFMTRHFTHLLACFLLLIPLSRAADPARDPAVPKEILSLRLDPMEADELKAEADAWLALLKETARSIADLEISLIEGGGDAGVIDTELAALRARKSDLIERTEIVLGDYELKGGDAANSRAYIAAVKKIKPDATDVASRYHAFSEWLASREGGVKWLVNAVKFISVMLLFWVISAIASRLIARAISKQPRLSSLLKTFVNKMSRRLILAVGLIVALGTVGVNVGAALALIGGGAFILAFALQDTLSNFANGIMLIIYRPFDVGDAVEIGGVLGKVDGVSLVSTTILTFDNSKVLVPNKKVWGEVITNITGMPTRRVDMLFGIGYGDDVGKAREIIGRVVSEHPLVLAEPEPNIGVHELADSSVNIRCWPWAKTSDFLTVRSEVTERVKAGFDAAGISIPFPQRDVHIHRETAETTEKAV